MAKNKYFVKGFSQLDKCYPSFKSKKICFRGSIGVGFYRFFELSQCFDFSTFDGFLTFLLPSLTLPTSVTLTH